MTRVSKGYPGRNLVESGTFSSRNDRIFRHAIEFTTPTLLKRAFDALIM